MFEKMTKNQKALAAFAVSYVAYGAMFIGPQIGLPDAAGKFYGKPSGSALTQSAATWTGLGAIILGVDCAYAATQGSKNVVAWTMVVNVLGCFMRLGVFAAQGSTVAGGALVAAEYNQGLIITLVISFTSLWCLSDGVGKVKNPVMGCDGLTHGCLLFVAMFYSAYLSMFFFTDFVSQQYVVPKSVLEPAGVAMMAWNMTMWLPIMLNILAVLAAAPAKEMRQWALMRTWTVLASVYLMHSEAAIANPSELTNGYVGQTIALLALVCAGLGDKIKPKKAKRAPAKAASKKRR